MYIYEPPEKWTEALLADISDEDNRYEFKLWDETWKNINNEVESLISKEICALANSFGGTLFFGVQDKTKRIFGIPQNPKGNADAKSWIEGLIPNWLEFRLPYFRVLEVDLSSETKKNIGKERTVLSIDIYDSDLVPHCVATTKRYYYRQSSASVPAPHHYLTYLWGRSSPNMSYVINKWFKDYVNILIDILERSAETFEENSFNSSYEETEGTFYVRRIEFFSLYKWTRLNTTLIAKQFLRTFPDIKKKLDAFETLTGGFFEGAERLENAVLESEELNNVFQSFQTSEFLKREFGEFDVTGDVTEVLAQGFYNKPRRDKFENLLNYPEDFKRDFAKNNTYLLMGWKSDDSLISELAKKYSMGCLHSPEDRIIGAAEAVSRFQTDIAKMARSLADDIAELRHALALKHNTTYE